MKRTACGIVVVMLNLSVPAESVGQDKSAPPAEQFQALRKEYDRASSSGVPLTDAERLKFIGEVYKRRRALAIRVEHLECAFRMCGVSTPCKDVRG